MYCVSFRIADGGSDKSTYEQRYEALMENIQKAKMKSGGYWIETTSFLLVESALGTQEFCAAITKGLNAKKDMVVVFDPSDMSSAYFGSIEHPDVFGSFFKTAKKVG